MVLIISNTFDISTSEVVDWIYSIGEKVMVITEDDEILIDLPDLLDNKKSEIWVNSIQVDLNSVTSIWLRKGGIPFNINKCEREFLADSVVDYLTKEWSVVEGYLLSDFMENNHLGDLHLSDVNKLKMLKIAAFSGLNIPVTGIVSSKKNLKKILDSHTQLIVKPCSSLFGIPSSPNKEDMLVMYSNAISMNDYDLFPESFLPLFIQEKISRQYEVRVISLSNELYSTAVIPYNLDTDDIRGLDVSEKRYVPYKLPADVENSIRTFLKSINCSFGCMDLIVSPDNTHYFLEINPNGQFGAYGYYSGYNLYSEIAKFLTLKKKLENEESEISC